MRLPATTLRAFKKGFGCLGDSRLTKQLKNCSRQSRDCKAAIRNCAILSNRHLEHGGVRSKLKTYAQPYHGGDGCKAELKLYYKTLFLKADISVSQCKVMVAEWIYA